MTFHTAWGWSEDTVSTCQFCAKNTGSCREQERLLPLPQQLLHQCHYQFGIDWTMMYHHCSIIPDNKPQNSTKRNPAYSWHFVLIVEQLKEVNLHSGCHWHTPGLDTVTAHIKSLHSLIEGQPASSSYLRQKYNTKLLAEMKHEAIKRWCFDQGK